MVYTNKTLHRTKIVPPINFYGPHKKKFLLQLLLFIIDCFAVAAESEADQGRTSSRQSERHQQLQQALHEELKSRLDMTKQRQQRGRRQALTTDLGLDVKKDTHTTTNTSSDVDNKHFNKTLWDTKPKRKAPPPPPPTRLQVHHHGNDPQHFHHPVRRNSVRYNSMLDPSHGLALGGSERLADQQTSLYTEFPTVTLSNNHTHKQN